MISPLSPLPQGEFVSVCLELYARRCHNVIIIRMKYVTKATYEKWPLADDLL